MKDTILQLLIMCNTERLSSVLVCHVQREMAKRLVASQRRFDEVRYTRAGFIAAALSTRRKAAESDDPHWS